MGRWDILAIILDFVLLTQLGAMLWAAHLVKPRVWPGIAAWSGVAFISAVFGHLFPNIWTMIAGLVVTTAGMVVGLAITKLEPIEIPEEPKKAPTLSDEVLRSLKGFLNQQGLVQPDEKMAVFITDVTRHGRFGEAYLVVTTKLLALVDPEPPAYKLRTAVPLNDLSDMEMDNRVGGGIVWIAKNQRREVLLYYTNAASRRLAAVAKNVSDYIRKRKEKPELVFDLAVFDEVKDHICPKCGRPLAQDSNVCPSCTQRGAVIIRLLRYAKPYWGRLAFMTALMTIGIVFQLAPPYITKLLVDEVLVTRSNYGLLAPLVLALIGIRIAQMGITMLRGRAAVFVGASVTKDLRGAVFNHLQQLSLGYFDRQRTGTLMSRVNQDTSRVENFLVDGVQYTVINLLLLVGIAIALVVMEPWLGIVVMMPAPVVVLMTAVFWRLIFRYFRHTWERFARLAAFLNDSLSGIRVVKVFGKENRETETFAKRNEDLFESLVRAETSWTTFFPVLSLVTESGGLLVWYVGGWQVIEGNMTLGTLMAFFGYLGMFYGPLQILTRLSDWLSRSMTSAERIFEVLDSEPDIKEDKDAVPVPRIEGDVEMKNVFFGYDKHHPVIMDFNLHVKPGEMIGLVGHSGAGKSTTINLICRLYDVDEGAVMIDGIDIKKIRIGDLRRQIGVVLQETYLFSGSVAENISYAKPDATREEIMAAAQAANAHDFIMKMPDGYDSYVGERGKNLSGGEQQRVAIARAILHNPRILILDEATSSVDTETERLIQEALGRLVKNRTTFAIAHRLTTLRNANRLVVLKDGKIAEQGTHDELLKQEGIYANLVKMTTEVANTMALAG